MRLTKRAQRTLMASAVAVLAFGAAPAMAADTPFGSCGGAVGTDCTAGTGHASVSVTSTLSINEMRALSFGNVAAGSPAATATLVLNLDGSRTLGGSGAAFVPLNGDDGSTTGGGATGTATELGSQSPGHFTISGGAEGVTEEVYISFANEAGLPVDMCVSAETDCDDYHNGNVVSLSGAGALTLDHFFINQTGSDVYGHYITNTAGGEPPGIGDPYLPGGAHAKSDGVTDGEIDVVVGGTLHGGGAAMAVGKHVGTFNIMASY